MGSLLEQLIEKLNAVTIIEDLTKQCNEFKDQNDQLVEMMEDRQEMDEYLEQELTKSMPSAKPKLKQMKEKVEQNVLLIGSLKAQYKYYVHEEKQLHTIIHEYDNSLRTTMVNLVKPVMETCRNKSRWLQYDINFLERETVRLENDVKRLEEERSLGEGLRVGKMSRRMRRQAKKIENPEKRTLMDKLKLLMEKIQARHQKELELKDKKIKDLNHIIFELNVQNDFYKLQNSQLAEQIPAERPVTSYSPKRPQSARPAVPSVPFPTVPKDPPKHRRLRSAPPQPQKDPKGFVKPTMSTEYRNLVTHYVDFDQIDFTLLLAERAISADELDQLKAIPDNKERLLNLMHLIETSPIGTNAFVVLCMTLRDKYKPISDLLYKWVLYYTYNTARLI